MNETKTDERWLWHVPGESGMYPTTFCICGDGEHALRYWRSMPTMAWRDDVIADQRSMMAEFFADHNTSSSTDDRALLVEMPHFLYIVDWFMGALAYGKHADESLGRRTNEWIESDLKPMRKRWDAFLSRLAAVEKEGE